jgi:hypothetical protein
MENMKNIFSVLLLVYFPLIITAQTYEKNIQYKIERNTAFRIIDNEKGQITGVTIKNCVINNWTHYYFILDEYNNSRIEQDKMGTYLFNYEGNLIDIIPFGATMESAGIFFSPNGKYFGVDSGTWTIRGMTFYTYPEYEKIDHIRYKGKFFWRDDVILYTSVGDNYIQGSPFDDDYYHFKELDRIKFLCHKVNQEYLEE